MKLKNVVLSSLSLAILTAMTACSTGTNNSPVQADQNLNTFSNGSGGATKYKLGFKLNTGKKVGLFNLKNTKGDGKADLRQFCSPVADQGQLGSCTAFAMGKGLREFLLIRDGQKLDSLSPLFLYYNERKIDGDINEDGGSTMATGMKALTETGISKEATWPYKTSKFKIAPPAAAYTEGVKYELKNTKNLAGLQEIKDELDKKNPVVFGFQVYSSFMDSSDGHPPVPNIKTEQLEGGHAVMAVGYDDAKGVLIMRNSWGAGWGDNGYFYMPYEYFKLGLVEDIWTASAIARVN